MAAGPATYAGLFAVTLATMMYEILLTRIFSVTMWYHFAFVAISVAMFGMTIGAVLVYLCPAYFAPSRTHQHLALASLCFALSIVVSILIHFNTATVPEPTVEGIFALALTYMVASVPFLFSGISVCLALTAFRNQTGTLYAADLCGAAVGCLALIYTLELTDGPTAALVVASLAGIAAVLFAAAPGGRPGLRRLVVSCALILMAFAITHAVLVALKGPVLGLVKVKGTYEPPPLYEKWNSFSRVHVSDGRAMPLGWAISSAYKPRRPVDQLWLQIDSGAGMPLTAFDGDLTKLDHLKYDVVNVVHYLKRDATVLILGVGGGRDLLAALVFGQKAAVGVEINENVLKALNGRFGDFTGHLDRHPQLTFVSDEARSYVSRQRQTFDIIQASLVDTWAATAAGAYVLSENSLYTVEAWKIFLEHLAPHGVLTVSRWYFSAAPFQVARLTSLARTTLAELGVAHPRRHLVVVRYMSPPGTGLSEGVGTILVKREPFTDEELNTLEDVSNALGFEVMLSPRSAREPALAAIATGGFAVIAPVPLDLTAPTDDRPFFFHVWPLRLAFHPGWWTRGVSYGEGPVVVLGALLLFVSGLTVLCVFVPLTVKGGTGALRGAGLWCLFFAAIGAGFMFVEISQMQRLIIFLGHPTYGLSVILFTLLVSSGIGSYVIGRMSDDGLGNAATVRLAFLIGVLTIFGALTPYAMVAFRGWTTSMRIVVAVLLLSPPGFFMGMAFPLAMRFAARRSPALTPWLWGINGATSVCASVLGIVLALGAGISVVFWSGVVAYMVALVAFVGSRPAWRADETPSTDP